MIGDVLGTGGGDNSKRDEDHRQLEGADASFGSKCDYKA